jgi:uncharacterized repeat protein (TIGR03803 family)
MSNKESAAKILAAIIFAILLQVPSAHADITLTTLVTFDGTNGYLPQSDLVQGKDGNFYGTLSYGGWHDLGTLFRMSPDGKCVILVTFDGENGSHPDSLIQGKDGNFYGTTLQGGPSGDGSVFKMTPDGTITTLTTFSAYITGFGPGCLLEGKDGNFYGVANDGGPHDEGAVFKMAPKGELSILFAFDKIHGSKPWGLTQDENGDLYGNTSQGTPGMNGAPYRLTLTGQLSTPATPPGNKNTSGLLKARDGNYYGTAFAETGVGPRFRTVFKTSGDGVRTTVVSFDRTNSGTPDGMVLGNDGNIYGITSDGGAFNQGIVFRVNLIEMKIPARTSPANINVPVLLHAVSNKVDPRILDAMQSPIEFYGKVVDEKNNPVADVDIHYQWMDLLARGMQNLATGKSDSNGLFSLQGKQGASMTVSVGKAGYYASHWGQQSVQYSKMRSDHFVPDPQKPVVFQLRKKGTQAALVAMKRNYRIPRDGSPTSIDLVAGATTSGETGNLVVRCWTDDKGKRSGQKYDWHCTVAIPGGGLVSTDEEFPFLAPESGFKPTEEIKMPADRVDWKDDVDLKFYYRLADGRYGRMTFSMIAGGQHFCMIDSLLNPSGSRNLEPAH